MYEAIIISIVVLLIAAIFINALQQHKAKLDSEKRAEAAKQRAIIDETENVIMACSNMPISPRLMDILHNRVVSALRIFDELNGTAETKQRVADAEQRTTSRSDKGNMSDFVLPSNDKLIIQYIQAVKRLRILLRSEHSRGKVDSKIYAEEDRQLERLQIKVNVETLVKRGKSAQQTNMLGSARQYFEKAKMALENQNQQDEYSQGRIATLNEWLTEIQSNLKSVNAQDRAKRDEEERDELDELFAPKKKW